MGKNRLQVGEMLRVKWAEGGRSREKQGSWQMVEESERSYSKQRTRWSSSGHTKTSRTPGNRTGCQTRNDGVSELDHFNKLIRKEQEIKGREGCP